MTSELREKLLPTSRLIDRDLRLLPNGDSCLKLEDDNVARKERAQMMELAFLISEKAETEAEALLTQLHTRGIPPITSATAGVMLAAGIIGSNARDKDHLLRTLQYLQHVMRVYGEAVLARRPILN